MKYVQDADFLAIGEVFHKRMKRKFPGRVEKKKSSTSSSTPLSV
jgi:hypothetical protein